MGTGLRRAAVGGMLNRSWAKSDLKRERKKSGWADVGCEVDGGWQGGKLQGTQLSLRLMRLAAAKFGGAGAGLVR